MIPGNDVLLDDPSIKLGILIIGHEVPSVMGLLYLCMIWGGQLHEWSGSLFVCASFWVSWVLTKALVKNRSW